MEAATAPAVQTEAPLPGLPGGVDVRQPAHVSAETPWRFSAWVHVGPGAEGCELGERGTCEDQLHFHAWCRLPNQFQHKAIREKAIAARARRIRQLRDEESDAFAVLEEDMYELKRLGDDARENLIDELLSRDWPQDYMDALEDVKETEGDQESEDGPDHPYAHVEADQERFAELDEMDPDKRPSDEYESLKRHLSAHRDATEAALGKIQQPKREALDGKDLDGLIELVREQRIASDAHQEFMHTYSTHSWLAGARTLEFSDKAVFASLHALTEAPPEVVDALKATFNDLERAQMDAAGNS